MTFLPTGEQLAFARSLDAMLAAADTPAAVRAWAGDDPDPGRALWGRLAEAGVCALAVPEEYEGMGPLPVELAHAFVALGRHAVPGPVVETVAAAVLLGELARLGDRGPAKRLLLLPWPRASGRRRWHSPERRTYEGDGGRTRACPPVRPGRRPGRHGARRAG